MMKKVFLSALVASLLTSTAFAEEAFQKDITMTENAAVVGFKTVSVDDLDFSGYTASFGQQWSYDVFTKVTYSKVSEDVAQMGHNIDLDYETLDIVLGKQFAINANTLWFAQAGYAAATLKANSNEVTKDDFTIGAGVKHNFGHNFVATAKADLVDSEVTFSANVQYNLPYNLAVSAGAGLNKDETIFGLNLHYFTSLIN